MTNRKQNILFVVCTYAFFWLVLIAGGSVLFLGNAEIFEKIQPYIRLVGTWTPTFAFLLLFKKICPGITVKEFYKNAFKERLNLTILLVFTILYTFVVVGAVGIHNFTKGVSFFSFVQLPLQSLVTHFIWSMVQGATGEESGWRGYLQPSMEKKYSVIKASVIVGIIWACWHMPTWFINGLTGIDLTVYILLDILDKMSIAMIIGICYSRCRNLIVPVAIHFISNFLIFPMAGVFNDLHHWYVLLLILAASGYIVWYKRINKKEITAV